MLPSGEWGSKFAPLVEDLLSDLPDWAAAVELAHSLGGSHRADALRQAISVFALAKMHQLKVCQVMWNC
jgi:hypothetical protein